MKRAGKDKLGKLLKSQTEFYTHAHNMLMGTTCVPLHGYCSKLINEQLYPPKCAFLKISTHIIKTFLKLWIQFIRRPLKWIEGYILQSSSYLTMIMVSHSQPQWNERLKCQRGPQIYERLGGLGHGLILPWFLSFHSQCIVPQNRSTA